MQNTLPCKTIITHKKQNVTSLYNALPPLLPQYNLLGFGRMRKIDLGESGGVSLILETRKKIILVIGQNLWFGVMSMHAT